MEYNRNQLPNEAMLSFASQFIGLKEIPGSVDNPLIVQMFSDIGHSWVKDDETSWCSAFINWVAFKTDCTMSGKLNARSWLNTGKETENPKPGDIVVLWRESMQSWKGHVGIFTGFTRKGNIWILGGNQGNEVNISDYSSTQLLQFRKPQFK